MEQPITHMPCACTECGHEEPFNVLSGVTEEGEGLIALHMRDDENEEFAAFHVIDIETAREYAGRILDGIAATESRLRELQIATLN